MKRSTRLPSAVSWRKEFEGNNVLRGYGTHYGDDWRCAAKELGQLGIELDPTYLSQREPSGRQLVNERSRRHEAQAGKNSLLDLFE